MQKLIDIIDPGAFQTGIFRDLASGQVGLWREAENVRFLDGSVEKAGGWSLSCQVSADINALAQAFADGEQRIYAGTATGLLKIVNGEEDELGSGYSETTRWEFETWGTWLIASNKVDKILVWKNGGAPADLGGLDALSDPPPTFTVLGKSNQQLLGYYGQTVYFSDKSDPESWAPTQTSAAGSLFIRELDSDVVAAKPLGDVYLVYSRNTVLVQEYVDSPFYFGFPSAPLQGIGALSADAIVPINNEHYGVCLKGFFVTDGLSFSYIDRPMVNRWFNEQVDPLRTDLTHGFHWEQYNTVRWVFVCKDGEWRGLDFNYVTKAWSIHTMPLTASDGQKAFDYPVIAEGQSVGLLGQALDRGGTLLPSNLRSFPFDAGTRENRKVWSRVKLHTELTGTVEFRLGFHDEWEAEPDWTDWQPMVQDFWLPFPRTSVFVTLEIRATSVGSSWRLGAFQVFGYMGGML